MKDQPNDPHEGHSPNVEPGRDAELASVDQLVRNLKYFWFLVVPILIWSIRVEGFIQKGDRQTASMAIEQHQVIRSDFEARLDALPPQLYRDYVDLQFLELNKRLDRIEALLENR